jgi:hypothetical protein
MKKHSLNNLLKNLMYVAFGLVFAIGISYIHADGTYTDNSNPPANNTPTPLNVGTTDQTKPSSSCTAGNCGGLSLGGTFIANQNAAFNALLYVKGLLLGGTLNADGTTTDGTLAFGDSTTPASLQINGDVDTSLAMQSDTLKNTNGDYGICSNADGYVVLCNIDVCSNISGLQLVVPTGDVANANGTCTPAPKEFLAILQSQKDYNIGDTNTAIGGNVVNDGDLTEHDPNVNNQGYGYEANGVDGFYMPYIDGIGLDNDSPSGWLINQIPGVKPNQLAQSQQALLTVVEAGSYKFTIDYTGQFDARGKSTHSGQNFGVDFYMQILHQSTGVTQNIPLDTANSGQNHENYPINGDKIVDFAASNTGTAYHNFAPYTINFKGTYSLLPGDQVSLHSYIYGASAKSGFFATCGDIINSAGCYENFYYNIQANQGSSIDIVETPSQ